jgi:DNA-directed RNA polymerase specialized sigma subunit
MQCPHNQGGDLCALHGTQNSQCVDFSKWEKSKKSAQEIKMPLSIHDKSFGSNDSEYSPFEIKETSSYFDYESEVESFHKKIKDKLTLIEWKIYNFIYIENKNECDTAKLMGYKTSEKNRSPGYKQIKKIKNKIYKIDKDLLD